MKKTVLAAALAASSCWAHAQSSVTIFGVLDAGVTVSRGSVSNATELHNSGLNSSRIGFRGVEDLGGGLRAVFHLEGAVNNDDGSGATTSLNNQPGGTSGGGALTFNRKIHVGLLANWGEVRLGRDYTPIFTNKSTFSAFGTNGVGGTQVHASNLSGSTGVRASNSVAYYLPRDLGGFHGTVMHFRGENPSSAANRDAGTGTGARFGWGNKAIKVAAAAQHTNHTAGDIKTWNIGGSYDFGAALLSAMYNVDSVQGGATGKGGAIGVNVPVGPHEFRAAYSYYERDTAGNPKAAKYAVGYVYALSKRTQLYTAIARLNNSGGSALSVGSALTGANRHSTGFDLGVAHSF